MNRLELVVNQIKTARNYTSKLLDQTNPQQWFRQPGEGVTHIAWQVGHLAFAEYAIALRRLRGRRPGDEQLLPLEFEALFGRLSVPQAEASVYPAAEQIRDVLDNVHRQALQELETVTDEVLDESTADPPHPMHSTKFGALQWCAQHEFLHAGEIALLRRLLGGAPLW